MKAIRLAKCSGWWNLLSQIAITLTILSTLENERRTPYDANSAHARTFQCLHRNQSDRFNAAQRATSGDARLS